jgi:hypothetical protein
VLVMCAPDAMAVSIWSNLIALIPCPVAYAMLLSRDHRRDDDPPYRALV